MPDKQEIWSFDRVAQVTSVGVMCGQAAGCTTAGMAGGGGGSTVGWGSKTLITWTFFPFPAPLTRIMSVELRAQITGQLAFTPSNLALDNLRRIELSSVDEDLGSLGSASRCTHTCW